MHTVHNARIQLLATLLNTMAGTSFTVGVVAAPIAAGIRQSVLHVAACDRGAACCATAGGVTLASASGCAERLSSEFPKMDVRPLAHGDVARQPSSAASDQQSADHRDNDPD